MDNSVLLSCQAFEVEDRIRVEAVRSSEFWLTAPPEGGGIRSLRNGQRQLFGPHANSLPPTSITSATMYWCFCSASGIKKGGPSRIMSAYRRRC